MRLHSINTQWQDERQAILTQMLGNYNKKLETNQYDAILTKDESYKPLYLVLVRVSTCVSNWLTYSYEGV